MEKDIVLFEKILEQIDSKLSKELQKIAPINIEIEKKKFYSQESYNPKFKYFALDNQRAILSNIRKLDSIQLPNEQISKALKDKAIRLGKASKLAASIGTESFAANAQEFYGLPSKQLLKNAKQIISKIETEKSNSIKSSEAYYIAKKWLEEFRLEGWKVKYGKIISTAMVQSSTKTIFIRRNASIPSTFLKRLMVHEIVTHVFRSANGASQPFKIFSSGFADYLETEEGLATNVEEMHGCLDKKTLRTYAGRVLAVEYASKNSFRDTYNRLLKHFSPDESWQLTLRVKRGMSETSNPGCFPKDHLYLKGYYTVQKYLEGNPKTGLQKLYFGKLGIKDLGIIDEKNKLNLIIPKLMPNDRKVYTLLRKI